MLECPRMRRLATCLLLLCVVDCARDLSEVATPDPAAEPVPAFLGEMAGWYEAKVVMTGFEWDNFEAVPDPQTRVVVPVEISLIVMHLQDPAESGVDAVSMTSLTSKLFSFATGTTDGLNLTLRTDLSEDITATRLAGGGALRFGAGYSICPSGPEHELVAERQCPFNPSLSGVYAGETGSCSGAVTDEETFLAVGFLESEIIGMRYPETATVLIGGFDRFDERGCGLLAEFEDVVTITAQGIVFDLAESNGELSLEAELTAPTSDLGAILDPCRDGIACHQKLSLKRLSGGEATSCEAFYDPPERVYATFEVFMSQAKRYLNVVARTDPNVGSPSGDPETLPSADVVVRNAGDSTKLLPIDPSAIESADLPALYTRLFELPAVAGGEARQYELLVSDVDSTTAVRRHVTPICLEDDGVVIQSVGF